MSINKVINSRCVCKKGLPWVRKEVVMIEPCEHLIHKKCLGDKSMCPFCFMPITRLIHRNDFKKDKRMYQKCIDIISMSNFDFAEKINIGGLIINFPIIFINSLALPFIRGTNNGVEICETLFNIANIKIKVNGFDKIKTGPKVFVANHSSHLDFLVLFYILKSGFLASSVINDTVIGKMIAEIVPLLIIDRGDKSNNTVNKMNRYVKKYGSICLFPEGMITQHDTIIRFRTGAFHIGYPVYPVVLKYKNISICDSSITNFIMKLISGVGESITIDILDPFYPPFDDSKIEMVRYSMANNGNMLLSRVSNKDIVDK